MTEVRTRSNSLRANTLSQGVPVAAGYALNILSTPVVVHQLGLRAFGIWAITVAVAQYGAVFDFGISRSVTRFVALHHARGDSHAERQALTVALAALTMLGATLVVAALAVGSLAEHLGATDGGSSLIILALCAVVVLVTGLLGRALASFAFGRGRMVALNAGLAASNSTMIVVGVGALLWRPTLNTFAIGTAIGALLGLGLVLVVLRATEGGIALAKPENAMLKEMVGFGLKGQTVLIADLVVFQSSKLIIGALLGASAAGVYELGSRLALGGRTFGSLASTALTPVLTRAFARSGVAEVTKQYEALAARTVSWAVIWPLLVAGAGPALVPLWLGYVPHNSVLVVTALSFGFAINVATGTATVAALSVGRAEVVAKSALMTTLIFVVPVIPLTLVFGVPGAVASIVIATILGAVYGVQLSCRAIGAVPMAYYKAVGSATVGGMISAGAGIVVATVISGDGRVSAAFGVAAATVVVSLGFLASAWVGRRRLPAVSSTP